MWVTVHLKDIDILLLLCSCDNYSWYMDVLEQVTIVLPLRTSQNTCTAQCKSTWRSFSDYPTMLTLHRFDAEFMKLGSEDSENNSNVGCRIFDLDGVTVFFSVAHVPQENVPLACGDFSRVSIGHSRNGLETRECCPSCRRQDDVASSLC